MKPPLPKRGEGGGEGKEPCLPAARPVKVQPAVTKPPTDDDRFNLEVIKLLLKIAWVDQELEAHEKNLIVGAARSWAVPEPELKQLLARMEQGDPLPEPDVQLLRTRADDVMTAARALVLADGKVKKEESALLKQLAATLA